MDYLNGVLSLLDSILRNMFDVPIFLVFLGGFVMAVAFGIFIMFKGAAGGVRGRK